MGLVLAVAEAADGRAVGWRVRDQPPQVVLQGRRLVGVDTARNVEHVDRTAIDVARQFQNDALVGAGLEDRGEIEVGERRPQDVGDVQVYPRFLRPFVRSVEPHHHVGGGPLRNDELRAVALQPLERRHDLIDRIAAGTRVALELPFQLHFFLRLHVELDVISLAQARCRVAEEPLENDVGFRLHVLRRLQDATVVVVDGLEDRLPVAQQGDVLLEDVHVVAVRIMRRNPDPRPVGARIPVVVVDADIDRPIGAQGLGQPGRQGGLPRRGVADDTDDHRCLVGARRHTVHAFAPSPRPTERGPGTPRTVSPPYPLSPGLSLSGPLAFPEPDPRRTPRKDIP